MWGTHVTHNRSQNKRFNGGKTRARHKKGHFSGKIRKCTQSLPNHSLRHRVYLRLHVTDGIQQQQGRHRGYDERPRSLPAGPHLPAGVTVRSPGAGCADAAVAVSWGSRWTPPYAEHHLMPNTTLCWTSPCGGEEAAMRVTRVVWTTGMCVTAMRITEGIDATTKKEQKKKRWTSGFRVNVTCQTSQRARGETCVYTATYWTQIRKYTCFLYIYKKKKSWISYIYNTGLSNRIWLIVVYSGEAIR